MKVKPEKGILLVEDSQEDFEAIVRALKSAGWSSPIYHCWLAEEALDFLNQRGSFAPPTTTPRPGIILLDLNLPGTDGREVLREIKSEESLKSIPVIILTTSRDERDIEGCYRAGANCYIQKPIKLEDLYRTIKEVKDYWFKTVLLP